VSRVAAVAFEPEVALDGPYDGWPGRGDSSVYRLLGDDAELFGGPRPILIEVEPVLQLSEDDYLQEMVEMPGAYFSVQESENKTGVISQALPRLILCLAVALLLAIALVLVTPVLASGRNSSNSSALSLSRYADLAAGASSSVTQPEIDLATGPQQVAEPAAKPAPLTTAHYTLVAPPSLSVAQIEAVLIKYGSPAVGQGQTLYDLGVRYGIDPAYALAFFVHESGCGTKGVARFTNSLGNIRWSAGYENYEGYRMYGSWQEGMEDWYKLITDLYINGWGLKTVDAIIPVYAPAADSNNPPVYIASVKSMVDSWRGK
jgi:hypothetical protein